jgi:hypothetical protein
MSAVENLEYDEMDASRARASNHGGSTVIAPVAIFREIEVEMAKYRRDSTVSVTK